MPSPIGHGPVALRIKQRDFSPGKKLEEVEKRGKDGAIVRYQRKVADGLLHRMGRFFSDHAKGITKARGTLCDRAPNNVPTHIMVRGQLLATRRADGTPSPAVDITLQPNRASEQASGSAQPHNLSRIREDLRFQIDVKGNKSDRAAMETFLTYATGETSIPSQIKGDAQRREMDSVIRHLKQFVETFSELEQQNGLHEQDAKWVKKEVSRLLTEVKGIKNLDDQPDVNFGTWKNIEEFKALQASIKLTSAIASDQGTNTLAQTHGPAASSDLPSSQSVADSTLASPIAPDTRPQEQPSTQAVAGALKHLKKQRADDQSALPHATATPSPSAPLPASNTAATTKGIPVSPASIPATPPQPTSSDAAPLAPPPPPANLSAVGLPEPGSPARSLLSPDGQAPESLAQRLRDLLAQHQRPVPANYKPDQNTDWDDPPTPAATGTPPLPTEPPSLTQPAETPAAQPLPTAQTTASTPPPAAPPLPESLAPAAPNPPAPPPPAQPRRTSNTGAGSGSTSSGISLVDQIKAGKTLKNVSGEKPPTPPSTGNDLTSGLSQSLDNMLANKGSENRSDGNASDNNDSEWE